MIKEILDYIYNMRFNSATIGIQKDLLLASLIGVISNLPKEVKSNFKQFVHIITGTLLSTILTPMIIIIIEKFLNIKLPPESGYGIAALIGIVGINTIKKFLTEKLTANKKNDEDD
jgi:hypothetical protein